MKSVLITGCSKGGIGSSLAESFQKRSLHVFATARSLSKMSHLADLPNVTLLTLDVTSSSSITEAVRAVSEHGNLDYPVNNAGVNYVCPTLDVDIGKAKEFVYCTSGAATTIFDKVLRIEMSPLGMVVTVITGSVATNLHAGGSGFESKPGSQYAKIEGTIKEIADRQEVPNQMSCEDFAEKVVGVVLGEALSQAG